MRIANSDLMTRKQCYTVFVVLLRADYMKNVTITLDDQVADWARVWAAQHRTSVSRMLGNLLAEKMAQDERYAAAMNDYLAAAPESISAGMRGRAYPRRDAAHER